MSLPERIGPYRIERELGRGGMGIVYAGVHEGVGRRAAIKVLLNEQKGEDRFWRECEALGQLNHPGIVQVYEAGVHGGHPYLALEFVPGKTLDDNLSTGGPWDSERTARLGLELCQAMSYVHERGLLHRDLKPENVLLDEAGAAKITDFGLVRGVGAEALTRTGVMVGTPSFMPPEQAGGEKDKVCPASDVYSLGATLFMVLTGQPPFRGDSPYSTLALVFTAPPPRVSSLAPSVDPVLDEILLRCLAKQPSDRYPDAAALGEALRAYLGGELEASARTPRGALVGGIAVLSCLLLVIGGLLLRKYTKDKPAPTVTARVPTEAEARSAWLEAKAAGTSAALREWCGEFEHVAGSLQQKVRRRLAEVSWIELGGPEPEPGEDDLRKLRHFEGLGAWLAEHRDHAPKLILDQALELKDPWASSKDAPLLGSLTVTPVPPGAEGRHYADAFALAQGRMLLYGGKPSKVWVRGEQPQPIGFGLAEGERILGAARRGETLWLTTAKRVLRSLGDQRQSLSLLDASSPATISSSVKPQGGLALSAGLLVYGEPYLDQDAARDEEYPEPGIYHYYSAGVEEGPRRIRRTRGLVRAGVASRDGARAFLAGGGTQATDTDHFLLECRLGPGGLEEVRTVTAPAAARALVLSPSEDRLFAALNRGSVIYLSDDLACAPLPLSATLRDTKEETSAGFGIEATGGVFLPGGLLVSYDFATHDEGWLAFYAAEDLGAATIREGDVEVGKDRPKVYPRWRRDLPSRCRTMTISEDGELIFVGSRTGKVWVYPTPLGVPAKK